MSDNSSDFVQLKASELEAAKATFDLNSVVRVVDQNFQFMILLDDIDGNRFWHQFDGKSVDGELRLNKLYKLGQEKFRNTIHDQKDINALRNVLLAVSTLSDLFDYSQDDILKVTDHAIVMFAFKLYRRDKAVNDPSFADMQFDQMKENDEEFTSYITMVAFLAKQFFELIGCVRESVEQASAEINKVPGEEDNQ